MAERKAPATRAGGKKAPAAKKGQGTIKVQRIVRKEVVDGEEQEVEFDAEVFETAPAYVRMEVGVTRSIGEFESLRVSCAAEVPTYKERLEETKEQLAAWCAESVDTEVDRYLEAEDPEGEEEAPEGEEEEGEEEEEDDGAEEGEEEESEEEGEEEEDDEVTEEEVIEADRDELESLIDECELEQDPEEFEDDEELRAAVFEELFEKKLPKKKAPAKGRGRSRK